MNFLICKVRRLYSLPLFPPVTKLCLLSVSSTGISHKLRMVTTVRHFPGRFGRKAVMTCNIRQFPWPRYFHYCHIQFDVIKYKVLKRGAYLALGNSNEWVIAHFELHLLELRFGLKLVEKHPLLL